MEKIRKGNDIEIRWAIYVGKGLNETPYVLSGKDLTLYLKNPYETVRVKEFTTEGHIISFKVWGRDQHTGTYTITLVENEDKEGMHTVDECDAFKIVSHSCLAGGETEGRVECVHLQFRSNMGIFMSSLGSSVEVDKELSLESENPVQNKVITRALQRVDDRLTTAEASLELVEDSVQSLFIKMDTLNIKMDSVSEKNDVAFIKVESFDGRMTKIESDMSTSLIKVEEMSAKVEGFDSRISDIEERIDILHADANTEGSVDNRIADALAWEEVEVKE